MKWTIPVCRTCHRIAHWPFCQHREDNGDWFAYVTVTGTPPPPRSGRG